MNEKWPEFIFYMNTPMKVVKLSANAILAMDMTNGKVSSIAIYDNSEATVYIPQRIGKKLKLKSQIKLDSIFQNSEYDTIEVEAIFDPNTYQLHNLEGPAYILKNSEGEHLRYFINGEEKKSREEWFENLPAGAKKKAAYRF